MDTHKKELETYNKVREMRLEVREVGEGENAKKEVRVSVSSEVPCLEYVFDDEKREWVRAMEVLGHTEEEIDRSRCADGLVIQDTHYGDQIGLIRSVELKDGKLGGVIEFCSGSRAQEIKSDAEKGLRRNMSVGYMVTKWERKDDLGTINGLPVYRAVRWTPYEASFVNVPADTQVGVGRSLDVGEETAAETAAKQERNSEMGEMKETPAVQAPAVDFAAERAAIVKEVTDSVVTAIREAKPETPAAQRGAQLSEEAQKEIGKRYDLMKVIRSLAGIRDVDAGFEREISDEIAKHTKREAQGFFIPEMVMSGRAFDKATYGAKLVATDTLFNEMVPALVEKTVLGQLGARTLTGLVGDVEIPVADKAAAYWVTTEGGDATATTPTIGQLKMSPKTVGAYTDITRKLMLQSGISAQAFIADALRTALAVKIEQTAFSGDGTSGAPTGIDNTTGINVITGATDLSLVKLLEFVTKIEEANAAGANMKFAGKPTVWAAIGSTIDSRVFTNPATEGDPTIAAAVGGRYLLDTNTSVCQGYDFVKANLATAKKLYFGDWSKLILGFWSGLDLTVDTASLSKSGGVRLVALQDMDIKVTQPKAFSVGQVIA